MQGRKELGNKLKYKGKLKIETNFNFRTCCGWHCKRNMNESKMLKKKNKKTLTLPKQDAQIKK